MDDVAVYRDDRKRPGLTATYVAVGSTDEITEASIRAWCLYAEHPIFVLEDGASQMGPKGNFGNDSRFSTGDAAKASAANRMLIDYVLHLDVLTLPKRLSYADVIGWTYSRTIEFGAERPDVDGPDPGLQLATAHHIAGKEITSSLLSHKYLAYLWRIFYVETWNLVEDVRRNMNWW
jgi:hypothetical protein